MTKLLDLRWGSLSPEESFGLWVKPHDHLGFSVHAVRTCHQDHSLIGSKEGKNILEKGLQELSLFKREMTLRKGWNWEPARGGGTQALQGVTVTSMEEHGKAAVLKTLDIWRKNSKANLNREPPMIQVQTNGIPGTRKRRNSKPLQRKGCLTLWCQW